MCDYCEKMKSIYWNANLNESPIREVYIEPDKTMSITANFGTVDGYESSNLNINFCPMCGKQLTESSFLSNFRNNCEVMNDAELYKLYGD